MMGNGSERSTPWRRHLTTGIASSVVLTAVLSWAAYGQSEAAEANALLGVWITKDAKSHVEISEANGKYFGKIVWLRDSLKYGKPALDDKNPDEELRNRPVLGMTIMRDFVYDGEMVWTSGKVYDPESGNDYGGKMTLVDQSTLDLRGYVLVPLFGRTERWTRFGGEGGEDSTASGEVKK
jgi:uncharacterized protein (DUF2147 family)